MTILPIAEAFSVPQADNKSFALENQPAVQSTENTRPTDLPVTNDRYEEGGQPLSELTAGRKHRQ